MESLQLSQVINAEFSYIQRYQDILDPKEATSIFNSIVTSVTENLVETIKFSVVNRRDPSQVFTKWEYDLGNNRNIIRSGPDLQRILELLKQLKKGSAFLNCEVRWSDHFLSLDPRSQAQILQNSYWGKKAINETQTQSDQVKSSKTNITKDDDYLRGADNRTIDFGSLEIELLKMESDIKYIDRKKRLAIYDSIKNFILNGYCHSIHFEILSSDQQHRILQWEYEIDALLKLRRHGASEEQVLALLAETGHHSPVTIVPILTQKFKELSAQEQQEVAKDTIWADYFKKRGLFG